MRPGDDPLELALHVLLAELVAHLRLEPAGRERVDADPLAPRPLLREVAREPDQPGLARGVGGLRQAAGGEPEDARDVDDRAARLHHRGGALRHPVAAVEVDVDHLAEVVGRSPWRRGSAVPTPALLTSTSTRPRSFIVVSTSAWQLSGSDTSARTAMARRPAASTSARVSSSFSTRRAPRATSAPASARRLRERDAEAGRGPGDDGDFSFEAEAVKDGHGRERTRGGAPLTRSVARRPRSGAGTSGSRRAPAAAPGRAGARAARARMIRRAVVELARERALRRGLERDRPGRVERDLVQAAAPARAASAWRQRPVSGSKR